METLLQHLLNGLSLGSIYALIALGYTLVYGILRLFNFAHGDLFMMGAYAALASAGAMGAAQVAGPFGFSAALGAAMAATAALGLAVERFAYRPLRGQPRINLLITAVGVSLLLENLGQVLFGATPRVFPSFFEETEAFAVMGASVSKLDLAVLITTLALLGLLEWVVLGTRLGRAMRAVAHDHATASLVGIPVDKVIAFTFALGSALAAAAAVLYGVKYPRVDPLMGILPGMKAFVAAVLGGVGNLKGAVAGSLILGLAETLVSAYGASTWRDALAFAILIGILMFKPAGLFGKYEPEKV